MKPVEEAIHAKVIELAKEQGKDARKLKNDQEIPATGLLDSAGLMELILWFETTYNLDIDQEELTMENFGTIDRMSAYLERKNGAQAGATE